LVQEHLESFLVQVEAESGAGLPEFVKAEFDAFLECGILAHGFLRLRCGECAHKKVKEVTGTYTLREQSEAYAANSAGEIEALRPEDTISWQETDETTET